MSSGRSEAAELPRMGSIFGHYRLDAVVGRGGMGVVFRATDLRLQRTVALKFLTPELAGDAAFEERFVRESRLAAAIEHASIVPIYEAGKIGDSPFISMRYVPGRDLGSIIRLEAPLALPRTIELTRQVADALDAAHRRGLVHRDVKPANVLIEDDGVERAYLTDFGLSRRMGDASASTRSGFLGSIDYVAPEQIEAGTVDGRADQYALACLVVHCLTGSPPFDGSDAAVLYAHVHADPPSLRALHPDLPASVDTAIGRALRKTPDERFPDCRTFVAALDDVETPLTLDAGTSEPGGSATGDDVRGRRIRTREAVAVAVVVAIVMAGFLVATGIPSTNMVDEHSSAPTQVVASARTDLRPGEVIVFASDVDGDWDLYAIDAERARPRRLTISPRSERSPAISPDGTTIAFVVGDEPTRDIWLMAADGSERRALVTGPADDIDPAWSSDGRSLAFASQRGALSYDIFEIRDRGAGLHEGNARDLTARAAVESYPAWRPGSRQLAVASNYFGGNREIVVIDADDDSSLRRVTSNDAYNLNPDYAPDGRSIAFVRRPFDESFPADRAPPDIFVVTLPSGTERRLTGTPDRFEMDPDWAPDGRAIAYAAGPQDQMEIWTMDPDSRRRKRLTSGWANATEPAWGITPRPQAPTTAPTDLASPS